MSSAPTHSPYCGSPTSSIATSLVRCRLKRNSRTSSIRLSLAEQAELVGYLLLRFQSLLTSLSHDSRVRAFIYDPHSICPFVPLVGGELDLTRSRIKWLPIRKRLRIRDWKLLTGPPDGWWGQRRRLGRHRWVGGHARGSYSTRENPSHRAESAPELRLR